MRHWFQTENLHTGGVPSEQVRSVQGLMQVVEYLDATGDFALLDEEVPYWPPDSVPGATV